MNSNKRIYWHNEDSNINPIDFHSNHIQIVSVVNGEVLVSVEIHEEIDLETVRTAEKEADVQDLMTVIDQDVAVGHVHQEKSNVLADESAHCTGMFHHQVSALLQFTIWFC